jgi:hypothetical protein
MADPIPGQLAPSSNRPSDFGLASNPLMKRVGTRWARRTAWVAVRLCSRLLGRLAGAVSGRLVDARLVAGALVVAPSNTQEQPKTDAVEMAETLAFKHEAPTTRE